ncbi:MAG TPA: hypothetical protein VIA45_14810 [Thermoanaerobaculia bacterium]|jgi:hypothetical protein
MEKNSFVLVHLTSPREKFWGLLKDETPAGITVRGLSLDGFEEWLRQVARKATLSTHPATVFFPMYRIERIFEDETAGELASFADRFRQTVGEDARYHLTPLRDTDAE